MRMDMATSVVTNVSAKAGDRGGKSASAQSDGGFGEALAARPASKTPQHRRDDKTSEIDLHPNRIGGKHSKWSPLRMPRDDEVVPSLHDLILATTAPQDMPVAITPQPDGEALPAPDVDQPSGELPDAKAALKAEPEEGTVPLPATAAEVQSSHSLPSHPLTGRNEKDRLTPTAQPIGAAATAPHDRGTTTAPQFAGRPADTAPPVNTSTTEPPARQSQPAQPGSGPEERPERPAPAIQRADMATTADRTAAEAPQPRISVLGFSTAAAPILPVQLGPTSAGLFAAIEAEPTWRAAAAEAAAATNQRGQMHHSVSTLRIQLNPAELGMVTARLTATGPQLEIEIRVESNDARQRLSNDSDAIVKALRAVGFDVDRVTIQQAQPGAGAPAQHGGQGRDWSMQEQGQGRPDANAGGRNGQNGAGEDSNTSGHGAGATVSERSGGGVYI